MNEAIKFMLDKYNPKSQDDYGNALKEILQEIVLLGLDRSGFFESAAFYGGTALRILHGLDRFSEDLDFTLLKPNKDFKLDKFFSSMQTELNAYGFQFDLERVEKLEDRAVESAFLKANTQALFLKIQGLEHLSKKIQKDQKIKIKFEVDVDPVTEFDTEIKFINLPSPYTVKVLTLPCLFAGKMHAALLRKWKTRIKGRDFYDVQWYLSRNIPVNKKYLSHKMTQSGALTGELTLEVLVAMFLKRIDSIDWEQARKDVLPFLRDKKLVDLWSVEYFRSLAGGLRLVD